jgi:hypothetical protein
MFIYFTSEVQHFLFIYLQFCSYRKIVHPGYSDGLDGHGIRVPFQDGQEIFLFSTVSRPDPGLT